jgi:hypothetical protein
MNQKIETKCEKINDEKVNMEQKCAKIKERNNECVQEILLI